MKFFNPFHHLILEEFFAQTAKQVISFNVREAEREKQFNDFIDKKDTILSGIVKRLEFGNVIMDLGRTEAIVQKNELIPRENIKPGDRLKAYCYDVRRETRGQQIFYQEPIQNLWKNFLSRKSLKSMMD